jgi:hypothetical protein
MLLVVLTVSLRLAILARSWLMVLLLVVVVAVVASLAVVLAGWLLSALAGCCSLWAAIPWLAGILAC